MPKLRKLLPLLLAAYPLAAPTASAAPDDVCVRQAKAVPGAPIKHPQWWLGGSLTPNQHEVRWTGASRRSSGDGSTPELAASRVIWDGPSHTAFFEITVNADPSIDTNEDLAMFAFSNDAGNSPELFVMFQPLQGCSPVSDCMGTGSALTSSAISYSQASGSGTSISWSTLSHTNTNADFTVTHPWIQVEEVLSGGTTVYNWKLRFAIELPHTGNNIRPNLRTYGNAVMYVPGPTSGSAIEFPVMCNNPSTLSNECLVFSTSSGADLPGSLSLDRMETTWPVMRTTDPGSCEGVELLRPLVGSDYNMVSGTVPGTSTPYELPGTSIPRNSGARLRAGFHNDTGDTIASGTITAEFRVADWGLQWANWDQATWTEVGSAVLAGDVAGGSYAGGFGQGLLESDVWVPADSDLRLENDHQCIHVKLSSNTPGLNFKVDSVYRNMDIVNASVARRPASIDLGKRRLPKGQTKHKVFLLTRSEHMPSPRVCGRNKKVYGCSKGGPMVLERKALTGRQKAALNRDFREGRLKMSREELDKLLKQKKRRGKKREQLPYYAVYGMVDTGGRINLPGAPQTPVLTNFSSYGYSVQHEGLPSKGWETYLHGAQRVNDSFYSLEVAPRKVVSVANTVRVLSKETKACKVKPKSNWAVYSTKKTQALEAKVKTDIGKGKSAKVKDVRLADDQLGCDPPPLRLPCRAKDCREHSPLDFIESNRYVGDWKAADKRLTKKPGAKRPTIRPGLGKATGRPGSRPGVRPAARPAARPTVKPGKKTRTRTRGR